MCELEKCIVLGHHDDNEHDGNVILVGKWTLEDVMGMEWNFRPYNCYRCAADINPPKGIPIFFEMATCAADINPPKGVPLFFEMATIGDPDDTHENIKEWGVNEFHADDPAIVTYLNLQALSAL